MNIKTLLKIIRAVSYLASSKSQAANRKQQIASSKSQAANRKQQIASSKSQAANNMATIHNNGDIVYNDAQLEKVEIALQEHYANLEPTQDEINEAGESFIKDNEFHSLQEMEIRYPESMDSQVGEEHPLLTTDEIRELQFHEQRLYADNVKEMNTNLANENYMFHCSVINLQQMCGSLQNQVAGFQVIQQDFSRKP